MPPDLNPPNNEKGYITGPDKTPHIAATAARVFGGEPGPHRRQQSNVNQRHRRCEICGLVLSAGYEAQAGDADEAIRILQSRADID